MLYQDYYFSFLGTKTVTIIQRPVGSSYSQNVFLKKDQPPSYDQALGLYKEFSVVDNSPPKYADSTSYNV